ncbi:MAG: TIM barrel protein [Bacillota bacterium]|nr:TIM barrel protein [Bacillota bacterium]
MSAGRPASPSGVRVGAHVSIGRGFAAMARAAAEIGCESVQVFTRSPRGGAAKKLDPADLAKMKRVFEGAGIGPLVVHTPYFVAPASHKEEVGELATRMIVEDSIRAQALGAAYVVVHAGHYKGEAGRRGPEMVALRVGAAIRELSGAGGGGSTGGGGRGGDGGPDGCPGGKCPLVLVENGAGGTSDASGRLEDWAECLHLIRAEGLPVGGCLDTAHLWGSGWEFDLADSGEPDDDDAGAGRGPGREAVRRLIAKLEELDVLSMVKVLHLNDSCADRGSCKDRHEHIGKGQIPLEAFRALLRQPSFAGVPGIVESSPDDGALAADMVLLKQLRDGR